MPAELKSKDVTPFFSIVIACLNDFDNLRHCVESINKQIFDSYEVLISDGGSIDETADFLASGRIRNLVWSKSSADSGIYEALNEALPAMQGQWVLVLGADDCLSDNNALARAAASICDYHGKCNFFYSNLYISDGAKVRLKEYPAFNDFSRRYGGAPFIHHQSALISSSAIRELQGFDTNYRIHSDYDLMLNVLGFGEAVKLADAFVVYDASGYSSRLRNIVRSVREVWDIRLRHGSRPFTLRLAVTYSRLLAKSLVSTLCRSGRHGENH